MTPFFATKEQLLETLGIDDENFRLLCNNFEFPRTRMRDTEYYVLPLALNMLHDFFDEKCGDGKRSRFDTKFENGLREIERKFIHETDPKRLFQELVKARRQTESIDNAFMTVALKNCYADKDDTFIVEKIAEIKEAASEVVKN